VRSGAPRVIVVATRRLLDEIIEAAVMTEHDMSAMLPDKAVFVGVAQCQSTNMIVALDSLCHRRSTVRRGFRRLGRKHSAARDLHREP
jgi:hypothetical protein